MSQSALGVDSNVKIQCIDKYGKVTRVAELHNKATVSLVEGLLRFMTGDFNRSSYNSHEEYIANDEADSYIPSEVQFGTVGVKIEDRDSDRPTFRAIDYAELKTPAFDEYHLQNRIKYKEVTGQVLKFDSIELTTFDNPDSSMGLLLRIYVPAGRLVGVGSGSSRKYFTDKFIAQSLNIREQQARGLGWSYYNPSTEEYETIFTEMGLFSGNGTLLARVLFDGILEVDPSSGEIIYDIEGVEENPVIQSDTSSLIIEWRIGIVSIGQNDHVVSGSVPVSRLDDSPHAEDTAD